MLDGYHLLIIDLARVESLDDVRSCELDGPKLVSSPKDVVVRKERNRAESLDDVRSCELDGPQGKLLSSPKDVVVRTERNRSTSST